MTIIAQNQENVPFELVGGKGDGLLKLKAIESSLEEMSFFALTSIPSFYIIPPNISLASNKDEILDAAKRLGTSFAVRSSSTLEDNGEHSFDGIFRTDLNVSLESLLDSIQGVRESALSDKARDYAEETKTRLVEGMPVVVQEMSPYKTTAVIYSKFPCPNDIVRGTLYDENSYFSNFVFMRELDEGIITANTFHPILSNTNDHLDSIEGLLANIAIMIENKFQHPIILESSYERNENFSEYPRWKTHILQARHLTGISDSEKSQIPELQKNGVIASTSMLNGSGDFQGDCCVAYTNYRGDGSRFLNTDEIESFDASHPQGYVLVTPHIEFYSSSIDEITKNKRAVVAYKDLGVHHDFEIARKKGILYLNCKDSLQMGFFEFQDNLPECRPEPPIKTGDRLRVTSDGITGWVYKI